ncbi:MAG: Gfo/Idh/MocA family oxidoreductase [Pseudomonadota bacterium]
MGSPIKVAIIGAGLVGTRHIAAIKAVDGVSVSAIADPSDAASATADEIGVACHGDWRAVLDPAPDGVIVATPNDLHEAPAIAALEAGVPVLLEKPIADASDAGQRIVETAERTGTPLLIGHHRRHAPFVQAAKARIDHGDLGRIVAAHGFFWIGKPDDYFDVSWRTKPGAGPVLINLIHDVEMMLYLCGDVCSVHARMSNAVRGYAVEDTTTILLEFASGALGTLTASDAIVSPWSWEFTSGENPAYPKTDQTALMIGGTKGSLSLPSGTLWSQERPDWWAPLISSNESFPPEDPLINQIDHFTRVIRGEELPLVTGKQALRALRVIEAIIASGKTNETVMIPPVA